VAGVLESFELKTLLRGPDDPGDAILTIHPGAGGTESQIGRKCFPGCTGAGPSAGDIRSACWI
jgi:hypothetical protein